MATLETLLSVDDLGRLLKERRLERNLPQYEVAKATGLSRVMLSRLESGMASDVKLSSLLRLLRHYGLKLLVAPGGRTPTLTELDLRRDLDRELKSWFGSVPQTLMSSPSLLPPPSTPNAPARKRARRRGNKSP